jgi:IMP dehydrogenase
LQGHKIEKLPVVNVVQISGFNFRDITKLTQKPIANKDVFRLRVAAAIGVTGDVLRAEALVNAGVDAIIIDTAHGHTQGVVNVLKIKVNFHK